MACKGDINQPNPTTTKQKLTALTTIQTNWGMDFALQIGHGWTENPARDVLRTTARLSSFTSVEDFAQGLAALQLQRLNRSNFGTFTGYGAQRAYGISDIRRFEDSRKHLCPPYLLAALSFPPEPEKVRDPNPALPHQFLDVIKRRWGEDWYISIPLASNPENEILESISLFSKRTLSLDVFSEIMSSVIQERRTELTRGRRMNSPVVLLEDISAFYAKWKQGLKIPVKRVHDDESDDEKGVEPGSKRYRMLTDSSSSTPEKLTMQTRSKASLDDDARSDIEHKSEEKETEQQGRQFSTGKAMQAGFTPSAKANNEPNAGQAPLNLEIVEPQMFNTEYSTDFSITSSFTTVIRDGEKQAENPLVDSQVSEIVEIVEMDEVTKDEEPRQRIPAVDTGLTMLNIHRAKSAISWLKKDGVLNDETITVCLQICLQGDLSQESSVSKYFVLDTTFSFQNQVVKTEYSRDDKRLRDKYAVPNFPILLAPIHHPSEGHWSLAVIDVNEGILRHYDSQQDETRYDETAQRIKSWMVKMNPEKDEIDCLSEDCPQQVDSVSCGLFAILVGCYIICNKPIPHLLTISKVQRFRENCVKMVINALPALEQDAGQKHTPDMEDFGMDLRLEQDNQTADSTLSSFDSSSDDEEEVDGLDVQDSSLIQIDDYQYEKETTVAEDMAKIVMSSTEKESHAATLAIYKEQQRSCQISLTQAQDEVLATSTQVKYWTNAGSAIDSMLYTRRGNMTEDHSSFSLEDQKECTRVLMEASKNSNKALQEREVFTLLHTNATAYESNFAADMKRLDAVVLVLKELARHEEEKENELRNFEEFRRQVQDAIQRDRDE